MKENGSKLTELSCDTCGSDNMNSFMAKNVGETCRQFGCFGSMKIMTKDEAEKLRESTVPYEQRCKNN
jgi:hypothetical protein